jgi:hypothetical protein
LAQLMDLHLQSLQSDVQIKRIYWLEHNPDHHLNDVLVLSVLDLIQKLCCNK